MVVSRFKALKTSHVLSVGVVLTAVLSTVESRDAHAMGALYSAEPAQVRASAEEIIFVDNPDPTITAIVRPALRAPAARFAWLIPVKGKPKVELSSSVVFRRLEAATAPEYLVEVTVLGACKEESAAAPAPPATAIEDAAGGDYDWTVLEGGSSHAVTDWLTSNGLHADTDALGPYLKDGFDVLALRPKNGADTGKLRPFAVTYDGERPVIPLRPTAAAIVEGELPLHVWIVGPSRAVPTNYASLVLNEARLDWSAAGSFAAGTLPSGGSGPFGAPIHELSNYDDVVRDAVREAAGHGFVTELAGPASQFRQQIWSLVDAQHLPQLEKGRYKDGVDAVEAAAAFFGGWDGWRDAVAGASSSDGRVSADDLARTPARFRGAVKVDTGRFFELLRERVVQPVADAATMFHRSPYLTRLYTRLSPRDMTVDPAFDYDAELPQVENPRIAKEVVRCRPGVARRDAPFRLELPHGGVVMGKTSSAASALPNRDAAATPRAAARTGRCSVSGLAGGRDTPGAGALLVPLLLVGRRRRGRRLRPAHALLLAALLLAGCGSKAKKDARELTPAGALTREELRNPESCKGCHPSQYREWSGSMHAYASADPVFVAMNKRGQRETHGKLGDFCLKCHAPMAVHDGLTKDGSNLEQLGEGERGVTCFFCHSVTAVEGDHNGMLRLAEDAILRGPIRDPRPPKAHGAIFSEIFDEGGRKSTAMCGGCHDIVTQSGVHLERTFEEYRHGIFSKSATGAPPLFSTCAGCHMPGQQGFAANTPGLPRRTVHEHFWPGIDVPLTDFPHADAMRSAVEDCELRASVSFFTLEVTPPDLFTFQVETNAGHSQPSGATQDRRMWLEVSAYDADGTLLDDVSSGVIGDGELEEKPESDPRHDPHLLLFGDHIYDAAGKRVHMFWDAEKSPAHPDGFESNLLPSATTTYIEGKHAVVKQYRLRSKAGLPARVTARLRVRPIGLEIIQDLVDSGDLDPAIAKRMPTFTFGAKVEWTKEKGVMKPVQATITRADCNRYRCLLDPTSKFCHATTSDAGTAEDNRY